MDSFDNVYADFNLAIDQYLEEKKQEKEMNGKIQNGCISSENMQVSEPGVINITPHVSELLECIEPWSNKDVARYYYASGLTPIVCIGKQPIQKGWGEFCHMNYAQPTDTVIQEFDVLRYFNTADGDKCVGIATGRPSGSVEVLDIESDSMYAEWVSSIQGTEEWDAIERCPMARTPRGGAHIFMFQPLGTPIDHSEKLAMYYNENMEVETAIETRGEGGQVVMSQNPIAPETHRHHLLKGNRFFVRGIPNEPNDRYLVDPELVKRIKNTCRRFNQVTIEPKRSKTHKLGGESGKTTLEPNKRTIHNRFNLDTDCQERALELLYDAGWTVYKEYGSHVELTRPNHPNGDGCKTSATYGKCRHSELDYPQFYVFSSNATDWEQEGLYSPWDVVRKLKYDDSESMMRAEAYELLGEDPQLFIEHNPDFQYHLETTEAPLVNKSGASAIDNVVADVKQAEDNSPTIIDGVYTENNENFTDTRDTPTPVSPVIPDVSAAVGVSEGIAVSEPTGVKTDANRMEPMLLTDMFPLPVAEFIKDLTRVNGVDPVVAALPLMALLSGLIGDSREAMVHSLHKEPPTLWTAVIMPSGAGKSPTLRPLFNPIKKLNSKLMDENKIKRSDYESHLSYWETDGKKLGLQKPVAPEYERLTVADATVEAVELILADNPKGLIYSVHELKDWFNGLIKQGVDHGSKWSKFYDGDGEPTDRITRVSVNLEKPLLSIGGMVQKGTLAKVLTADRYEQGVAPRFILANPEVKYTGYNEPDGEIKHEATYLSLLEQLVEMRNKSKSTLAISRIPESDYNGDSAHSIYVKAYESIGRQMQIAGAGTYIYSILSKSRLWMIRWSLIYATIKQLLAGNKTAVDPVDADAMQKGVNFAIWGAKETIRCAALLMEESEPGTIKRTLQWLSLKTAPITARELHRSKERDFPTTEKAYELLMGLVQEGVVVSHEIKPANGGKVIWKFSLKRNT